jgi:tetratricopeptide (TPR) repeat protein
MTTFELASIFYLLIFRLAIIATGVISIVIGYRLFCRGVWPLNTAENQSEIDFRLKGSGLTIRNAAPGTLFALFGSALVAVMVVQMPPGISDRMQREISRNDMGNEKVIMTAERQLRADQSPSLEAYMTEAANLFSKGQTDKALSIYTKVRQSADKDFDRSAKFYNELAWGYQLNGYLKKAMPLAERATRLKPMEAPYRHTYAVILCKTGNTKQAISEMDQANSLDPGQYQNDLLKMQSGDCN